jgi:hypothetical protein
MSHAYGLINDGMERKGYLPSRNYVCPEIRFWYRPMGVIARAIYMDALNKQPNQQSQKAVSLAMLTDRLVRWDLAYPDDWKDEAKRQKPVPTNNAEELKAVLDPHVEEYLSAIVAGIVQSQLDPKDIEANRAEQSKLQGMSPEEMLKAMAEAEGERQGN